MAFGTGAVTAAVVGGLASGAVGAGAGLLSGALGGGGGGMPAFPLEQVQKIMNRYVRDTKSDIFGADFTKAERDLAAMNKWRSRMFDGERKFYDKVAKKWITQAEYDAKKAELAAKTDRPLLKDVEKEGEKLTGRIEDLVESGDAALGERETELRGALDRENRALLDSQTSLGDRFLAAVGGAKSEFDSDFEKSMDLSPERLSLFTRAADFLSQAAVDTRAKMLAAADPRALELSAIADENAAAMMSGRISADVQANVARSGAMRALQGGFGASSQMGRGLVARDLGLTSLQLQQQGLQDFDRQRRLNFDTRVAGLQADAGALLADNQSALRQRALTNYEVGINVAESDRNQRGDAFNRVYGTNVGAAGDIFATGANRIGQNMQLLGNTADRVFGANTQARMTGFEALTNARGNAAATTVGGMVNNWAAQNSWAAANQSNQNALTGSLINTGASILGNIAGSFGGGSGSSLSSLGSFRGYTGMTNNPATGNSIGYATPTAYKLPGTSNWVKT